MPEQRPPTWFVCEVHTNHTDHDCEFCQRQLQEMQAELNELHGTSQAMNRQIAGMNDGVPYIETQSAVPQLAVMVLVNMILGDPKARMIFELSFHASLCEQMAMVHKEMVQRRLRPDNLSISPEMLRNIKRG